MKAYINEVDDYRLILYNYFTRHQTIQLLNLQFEYYVCRRYKNSCQQEPGINSEVISWMDSVWKEKGSAGAYEREGGLIFDEMTVQVNEC